MASWAEIVSAPELVEGERWEAFAQRDGDWGWGAALWLGRRVGRLRLAPLGELAGALDEAVVSKAVTCFGERLAKDEALRARVMRLQSRLSNDKT